MSLPVDVCMLCLGVALLRTCVGFFSKRFLSFLWDIHFQVVKGALGTWLFLSSGSSLSRFCPLGADPYCIKSFEELVFSSLPSSDKDVWVMLGFDFDWCTCRPELIVGIWTIWIPPMGIMRLTLELGVWGWECRGRWLSTRWPSLHCPCLKKSNSAWCCLLWALLVFSWKANRRTFVSQIAISSVYSFTAAILIELKTAVIFISGKGNVIYKQKDTLNNAMNSILETQVQA